MSVADPSEIVVRDPNEMVVVHAPDAFKALRLAERNTAAEWWQDWFENRGFMMGDRLMFRAAEGRLFTPTEIEADFPDAFKFDNAET